MAKRMTLGQCTAGELRAGGGIAPEKEERGADAFRLERVQDSKVSTSSLALSGSVDGKCLRPTRGLTLAFTSVTRSVPSACGLPGQDSADAATGRKPTIKLKTKRVMASLLHEIHTLIICPARREGRTSIAFYSIVDGFRNA